jgi:hypothetical protein
MEFVIDSKVLPLSRSDQSSQLKADRPSLFVIDSKVLKEHCLCLEGINLINQMLMSILFCMLIIFLFGL